MHGKTKCLFSELRNNEEYFLAFILIVSRALFKETWLSWITFLHWINFSPRGKCQCFSFNTQMFVRIKFIRGEQINSDKLHVFTLLSISGHVNPITKLRCKWLQRGGSFLNERIETKPFEISICFPWFVTKLQKHSF